MDKLSELFERHRALHEANVAAEFSGKIDLDGRVFTFIFNEFGQGGLSDEEVRQKMRSLRLSYYGSQTEAWEVMKAINDKTYQARRSLIFMHSVQYPIVKPLGFEVQPSLSTGDFLACEGDMSVVEQLAGHGWVPGDIYEYSNPNVRFKARDRLEPERIQAVCDAPGSLMMKSHDKGYRVLHHQRGDISYMGEHMLRLDDALGRHE